MDRPRIRVDFNELIEKDLILLSKSDFVEDSEGNLIELMDGKHVYLYEFNEYDDGDKDYIFAEGVAELNNQKVNGEWTKVVKWCCRIDAKGIRVKSNKNTKL